MAWFRSPLNLAKIIDTLMRRRQNNLILTGEPDVSKTTIVEGLALKIINGEAPERLSQVTLYSLDIGLLMAGAGVKGEFATRLKGVIAEIQALGSEAILIIDEAQMLIGAGMQVATWSRF